MSEDKTGINLYGLGSINWKGTQELIEKQEKSEKRIEELENTVSELKEMIKNLENKIKEVTNG